MIRKVYNIRKTEQALRLSKQKKLSTQPCPAHPSPLRSIPVSPPPQPP